MSEIVQFSASNEKNKTKKKPIFLSPVIAHFSIAAFFCTDGFVVAFSIVNKKAVAAAA